jgi:hypothetical protein
VQLRRHGTVLTERQAELVPPLTVHEMDRNHGYCETHSQ